MARETEPKLTRQMTLSEFDALFPNEEACCTYLLRAPMAAGVHCPRCGNDHVYASKARPWHWQCKKCGKQPLALSLLAQDRNDLRGNQKTVAQWFKVLHLMLTSKKGISALQIHRMIGTGSYRNRLVHVHALAWRAQRPRRSSNLWASSKSMKRSSAARKRISISANAIPTILRQGQGHCHRRDLAQGQRRLSDDREGGSRHDDAFRSQGRGSQSRTGRHR